MAIYRRAGKMVETPWGHVDELRLRALRPGPGTSRAEAARNRRERLFAAMVGCVNDVGYEATTVARLARTAGVSRAAFYEQFRNKHDCFVATVEAIVALGLAVARDAYDRAESWDAGLRATLGATAALVAAQPGVARLCYVDAYTVSRAAVEAAERGTEAFDAMAREAIAQSPEHDALDGEIVLAVLGGLQTVIEFHIRTRTTDQLPDVVPQLTDWALGYRAPAVPLRRPRGRRRPPGTPRRIDHDPVERIVGAMVSTVAEQGYLDTTVADVTRTAATSLRTFYEHFDGKEDCFLAALARGRAQALAAVTPVLERAPDWTSGVPAGLHALFAFLAVEADWAKVGTAELRCAGARAMASVGEGLGRFGALLGPGYELAPNLSYVTGLAIAGAVHTLVGREIAARGAERLPELVPAATFIVLTPFLGVDEAQRIAAGEAQGRARRSDG